MNYDFLNDFPVGIIIINRETENIIFCNDTSKTILKSNLFSYNWFDFIPKEYIVKVMNSLETEKKFCIQCCIDTGGISTWLDIKGQENSEKILYISILDITDAKSFNNIAEHVPDGMFIIKSDYQLTLRYANPAFYNIIGYKSEEFFTLFENDFSSIIYENDLKISNHLIDFNNGENFSIEIRLIRNDNKLIWVNMSGMFTKGLENFIYCILRDITQNKERQEVIENLSNDILFSYSLLNNSIEFSEGIIQELDMPLTLHDLSKGFINNKNVDIIFDQDVSIYTNIFSAMHNGTKKFGEFRMKNSSNVFSWYRVVYDFLYNSNKFPYKVVGKIMNIDRQKKLEAKAVLDSLTHVLNKIETHKTIESCIKNSKSHHALLIIDIDNFKQINDTYGHLFGDTVLVDICNSMKKMINENDIIGRIGGDEFAILIRNYMSKQSVWDKASELLRNLNKSIDCCEVSVSIGMSLFPFHGSDFLNLYQKADIALYRSKENGKNCLYMYDEFTNNA